MNDDASPALAQAETQRAPRKQRTVARPAEIVGIGQFQLQYGVAGGGDLCDLVVERIVGAQIGEESVGSVVCGGGFEVHRQEALGVLAGAFGDELFDPGTGRGEGGRGDEGQLVAA